MQKRSYTLADVERNLASIAEVMNSEDGKSLKPVDLINANHALMWWVFAHGTRLFKKVNSVEVAMLVVEPFWSLCAVYGIELNEAQKREIVESYVND
jgi:hypothetical protein